MPVETAGPGVDMSKQERSFVCLYHVKDKTGPPFG